MVARILLVDDERDIRDTIRNNLELSGHQVFVAESATAALGLAQGEAFDVAIIDYVLPGMRGLDLLRRLREQHTFLRSIIISGQIDHDVLDEQELERQLREGIAADRYFSKPVEREVLLKAVDELMRPASSGDWRRLAADAIAAQGVQMKKVREMDRIMKRSRKPRKK